MIKTDQQLVLEYLNGHDSALKDLILRHGKPVYNFVYRLTRHKKSIRSGTIGLSLLLW